MAPSNTDGIKMKVPMGVFNGNRLEAIQYRVEYIVSDFYALKKTDKICLRSPLFHVGNDDEYQARIICFFKGPCDFVKGCNGVGCSFVQFLSETGQRMLEQPSKIRKVDLSYMQSLSKGEETRSLFHKELKLYNEGCNPAWGMCTHVPQQVHYSSGTSLTYNPSSWINNGTLTLVCDITLSATSSISQVYPENKLNTKADISKKQLLADMSSLLGKTELSDIDIYVGGKTLEVHKLILSARSPVFAKMFQTKMSESKVSVLEITDMEYEEVQSLVVYMYTDSVPSLDDHAESLLSAADKYQLDGLKDKCEEALVRGLNVQNAARLFVLADLHRARHLKAKVVDFVRKNRQQVEVTYDWKIAKETHLLEMAALFL